MKYKVYCVDPKIGEWGYNIFKGTFTNTAGNQMDANLVREGFATELDAMKALLEEINKTEENKIKEPETKKDTTLCDAINIAADIIRNARDAQYGDPKISFTRSAEMASLMTNKEITATDVVQIMLAVKLMRESYKHKEDNLVDIIGYSDILNYLKESNY